MTVSYEFNDELRKPGRFCCTLARYNISRLFTKGLGVFPEDDTATLTFIEFEGRTYGITARHVIEGFAAQASGDGIDGDEGYLVPLALKGSGDAPMGPSNGLRPPFIVPKPTIHFPHKPDIALRPIARERIDNFGKEPFRLLPAEPTFPIPVAIAVGYPTASKKYQVDERSGIVSLPVATAVAEGLGSPDSDQLQFYSEVDEERIAGDTSGMSGGPVFWSQSGKFGLLGFVKESLPTDNSRVHFIVERATYERIADWTAQADREFHGEIDK